VRPQLATRTRSRRRALARAAFVLACLAAAAPLANAAGKPNPFPMEARLGANLYVQDSAEYRACCYGIYGSATRRLREILDPARPRPPKPAVVMDLDETVLDNSAFQTYLYANGYEYAESLWDVYESKYQQDVTLVPGAREFITAAESMHVAVVYITNRQERFQASTLSAMTRLGIGGADLADRVMFEPTGGTFDKSDRMVTAAARYNLLLWFGDNLRDFSEAFKPASFAPHATAPDIDTAITARDAAVDGAMAHWGVDWFVLPNPVYGEWEKLIAPNPIDLLRPTSMPVAPGRR
jgi:acid phosphatase